MKVRTPATLAAIAALALGAAACGDDEGSGTASSASASQSQPEPVAQVDALSGRSTAVTLDGGFVKALTASSTPAPPC